MTTYSDDRGSHADRLSRLDQLEREIAEERARLSRADTATDRTTDRTTDQYADRTTDRPTDQYADRNAVPAVDRGAHRGTGADDGAGRDGSVRTVDLPELEERVTESQREAWALGYQAGIADSQTRTGTPTQNPFHPLRG